MLVQMCLSLNYEDILVLIYRLNSNGRMIGIGYSLSQGSKQVSHDYPAAHLVPLLGLKVDVSLLRLVSLYLGHYSRVGYLLQRGDYDPLNIFKLDFIEFID